MASPYTQRPVLLDQRITIEAPVESKGATFADPQAASYATFATVWAAVEPLVGREWFRNQEMSAAADLRVTIRHLAGVTEKMRIMHGTRIYEIVAPPINLCSGHEQIQMMCREYRT
jgi:SPP1 family predicted phage head-tail adaptor